MKGIIVTSAILGAITWAFGFISVAASIGVLIGLMGWFIIAYVAWRNQRTAKDTDSVDDTNFGPRWAAIVETALHPDRASTWWRPMPKGWEPPSHYLVGRDFLVYEILALNIKEDGYRIEKRYLIKVFPAIGQDSSEQFGIREDDGVTS